MSAMYRPQASASAVTPPDCPSPREENVRTEVTIGRTSHDVLEDVSLNMSQHIEILEVLDDMVFTEVAEIASNSPELARANRTVEQLLAIISIINRDIVATKGIVDALTSREMRSEGERGSIAPIAAHVAGRRASEFKSALTAYCDERRANNVRLDDAARDAASDRETVLLEKLVKTRAPDLESLTMKIEIIKEEFGELQYGALAQIKADVISLDRARRA